MRKIFKINNQLIAIALNLIMVASYSGQALTLDAQNTPKIEPALQAKDKSITDTCPAIAKSPEVFAVSNESKDTPYVDYNREIKDFSTDFVIKEFFTTGDTLYNFLKLVYTNIDAKLKEYREANGLDDRAIFFLFKGGNVLRMLAHGIFDTLPPAARDILREAYEGYFKRSDSDFSIFIDSERLNGLDYEKVMGELVDITYDSLNEMRDIFQAEPEKYFNFLQLKTDYASKKLKEDYFDKLADLESIKDENNKPWQNAKFFQMQFRDIRAEEQPACDYQGQHDYRYSFANGKKEIIGTRLTDKPSWIMNTINTSLELPIENKPGSLVKFNLVRAKVQFEYFFEKYGAAHKIPIGGELIDVSFAHKDDFRLRRFLNHYKDWVATYTLTAENGEDQFMMKSESFEGLAADIQEIILEQFERPWEATKYEKRVNRLFFLSIVETIQNNGLGSPATDEYIKKVNQILTTLGTFYDAQELQRADIAKDISKQVRAISDNWPQITIAAHIWTTIGKMIKTQLIDNPKESDAEGLAQFLELIKANILNLGKVNDLPPQQIDMKDMYKVNIKNLL